MEIKDKSGKVLRVVEGSLVGADLTEANLRGANLRGANLTWANLTAANLRGANLTETRLPTFQIVPEKGSFIAWKKLRGGEIAKLMIPERAARVSTPIGRKCRAEYAKVLSITCRLGGQLKEGTSLHGVDVVYRVGKIVRPDSFNPDIRVECTHGIHFFITRAEAEEY